MAMLAEPRQRKRYNLVPKGKALYEDENSFGTKMLERMGWKKGQGLGAKEDGSKNFVRIRYKNDALGLGFEERDDQWTQHEQSFNGLLKTLNNEDDNTLRMENDKAIESENEMPVRVGFGFQETNNKTKTKLEKLKDKISGISLEERSKQSKARVHYKKFTKGKDLAQYSEKDLANIFGKKVVDEQHAANNFYQYLNNTFGDNRETSSDYGVSLNDHFKIKIESRNGADDEPDITNNSTSHEVQVEAKSKKNKSKKIDEDREEKRKERKNMIYSNISVTDYFKNKMEALKRGKTNNLSAGEDIAYDNNLSTEIPEETVTKKKKKSKKENNDEENDCLIEEPVEKKSKKNKHRSPQGGPESDDIKNDEEHVLKKEKKSKKCKVEENETFAPDDCIKMNSEGHVSKKQKKKCHNEETLDLPLDEVEKKSSQLENEAQNTEAKSKKCDVEEIAKLHLDDSATTENEAESIKKVKKSKKCRVKENAELSLDNSLVDAVERKLKKNKGIAKQENGEINEIETNSKIIIEEKKCDVKEIAELHLDNSAKTENEAENIKKVKKSKKCRTNEKAELSLDNSLVEAVEKKSKKNKGIVKQENGEINEIETNLEIINEEEKSIKCVLKENTDFPLETKTKKKNKPKKEIQIDGQNLENDISTAVKRKFGNSLGEIEASNGEVEASIEIDLTQEPTKKKKSKKNIELIHLDNSNKEITQNTEKPQIEEQDKITESKISQETHSTIENVLTISNPIEKNSDQPSKKPKKSKNKNVSSNAKNFMTEINFQVLDLEEIKKQYQAFNIYPISTFCAEKFRNINLNDFTGSILPQLAGYGLNADLQLDVKPNKSDEERITKLWKCALNKYDQLETRKKTYKQYLKEAFQVRKTDKKILKFNVKTLKRKNVFQVL